MLPGPGPGLVLRYREPDGEHYVYVEDVDRTVEGAMARGAKLLVEPTDQFWGDRTAWIMDPAGHAWTVATRVEEPTEAERRARWATMKG